MADVVEWPGPGALASNRHAQVATWLTSRDLHSMDAPCGRLA